MQKYRRRLFCFILLFILMLSSCRQKNTEIKQDKAEKIEFQYYKSEDLQEILSEADASRLSSYQRITENELLVLYVDNETSYIAVVDKRTGKVWFSVPPDISSDPNTNDSSRPFSQSTLTVDYTQSQSSKTMDNYTYCLVNKNFTISNIKNGVKILYSMGDTNLTIDDVPKKLSDARYKKFFKENKNLTEVDKKRLNKYFEYNKKEKLWKYVAGEEKVVYLSDIFGRVNYTDDELQKDNAEFGVKTSTKRAYFKIPVSYSLQNESLMVDIPLNELKYNKDFPPSEISLLQNFGATENSNTGYLFVPDGSGALLSFDSNQTKTGTYKARVYGNDKTIPVKQKSMMDYKVNMPIYGLKSGENAFFAVIEDSDALASINAVRAKTMNSYNSAYPSFTLLDKQQIFLNESGATFLTAMQKNMYKGNIRLRYSFLSKNDADYSGMARYYHSYLKTCYKLDSKKEKSYSLNLQIIGAIDKEKSFLGFPYNGIEALTTFDQTVDILESLEQPENSELNIQYNGWMNGGLKQYSAKKINVINNLGGKSGLKKLNEYALKKGVSVFYNFSLLSVPQGSKYFGKYSNAAKTINNSIANTYSYDIVTGKSKNPSHIVSLNYLENVTADVLKNSKKLNLNNLSFEDFGRFVYSDFGDKKNDNRQSALLIQKTLLEKVGASSGQVMLNDANVYAVLNNSTVVNAPLRSNELNLFDRTVPFYSMVLHGLCDYAGSALNYSDNLTDDILLLAETGAEPVFSFMSKDSAVVKFTDYTYLYAADYSLWKDKTKEIYQNLKSCLSPVQNKQIISHEQVEPNVFKTTYEDGSQVYVNYNDYEVTENQTTIGAKKFKLIRGEGK